jgi:hypothetical protein
MALGFLKKIGLEGWGFGRDFVSSFLADMAHSKAQELTQDARGDLVAVINGHPDPSVIRQIKLIHADFRGRHRENSFAKEFLKIPENERHNMMDRWAREWAAGNHAAVLQDFQMLDHDPVAEAGRRWWHNITTWWNAGGGSVAVGNFVNGALNAGGAALDALGDAGIWTGQRIGQGAQWLWNHGVQADREAADAIRRWHNPWWGWRIINWIGIGLIAWGVFGILFAALDFETTEWSTKRNKFLWNGFLIVLGLLLPLIVALLQRRNPAAGAGATALAPHHPAPPAPMHHPGFATPLHPAPTHNRRTGGIILFVLFLAIVLVFAAAWMLSR